MPKNVDISQIKMLIYNLKLKPILCDTDPNSSYQKLRKLYMNKIEKFFSLTKISYKKTNNQWFDLDFHTLLNKKEKLYKIYRNNKTHKQDRNLHKPEICKILASIISTRLKPILNSIISHEQQCGLPNRQIFNNHLNILSAINYTNDFPQLLAILLTSTKHLIPYHMTSSFLLPPKCKYQLLLQTGSKYFSPISPPNLTLTALFPLLFQLSVAYGKDVHLECFYF